MAKFIECTKDGLSVLVNLDHVEEVCEEANDACRIYFAFNIPDAIEQDSFVPDQGYRDVKNMIWGVTEIG